MDVEFETDKFPVIKAKHFKDVFERRKVRLIVIHSMEAPEKGTTAENVAKFFQNPPSEVSAHLCIDNNSIVQCVFDNDIAFAAPGANHDGLHLELAGFARQTREKWLDPFSILVLDNAANAAAQYCLKYNISPKHLANDELKEGQKGIVGHVNMSQVFKKSTHTDPGTDFPWDILIERVKHHFEERKKEIPCGVLGGNFSNRHCSLALRILAHPRVIARCIHRGSFDGCSLQSNRDGSRP